MGEWNYCGDGDSDGWDTARPRRQWPEGFPPEAPQHFWSQGCCLRPRGDHLFSPDEVEDMKAWANTEPGLRQWLNARIAQLERLEELHAPEVILDNQLRLVNEVAMKLGWVYVREEQGALDRRQVASDQGGERDERPEAEPGASG